MAGLQGDRHRRLAGPAGLLSSYGRASERQARFGRRRPGMNDVPQGATGTLTDDGSETGGGGSPVGSPWTMVTILSVLSFISLLDRQIFALAVDPIRQELGFS